MPRIYQLSRTGLKLLYKIRHHKGHGIHSPFVFNLVNKVIEEKMPYHAYDDIRNHIISVSNSKLNLSKFNLLSFRLINYFEAKKILEIGSGAGINTICLTAPSKQIQCFCFEESEEKYTKAGKIYSTWDRSITLYTEKLPQTTEIQDCIIIDLNNYNHPTEDIIEYCLRVSNENTFIVIKGIRTNRRHQVLWKRIKNIESRTAVLDLFNIGIVFFDKKLYRWDYQISF